MSNAQPNAQGCCSFTCEKIHASPSKQLRQCTPEQLVAICKALSIWLGSYNTGKAKTPSITWLLRPKGCEVILDLNNEVKLLDEDCNVIDINWAKLFVLDYNSVGGLRVYYRTGLGGLLESTCEGAPASVLLEHCKTLLTKHTKETLKNNLGRTG